MQQLEAWDAFLAELARRPVPPGVQVPPAAPLRPVAVLRGLAASLNVPLTSAEVQAALRTLHNGRSAGVSGLPAELLRYAIGLPDSTGEPQPHILLPALTAVLNSMFQSGEVPAALNVSLVTPVYKRGPAAEPGNYRPIAVGEPLLRLYASILNRRVVQLTEREGLRAPTQAGFRPKLSTVHQLFALQHLVDHARSHSRPLFTSFLDLKGAYDRVSRHLLWEALQRLGLHGEMLAAIRSLYADAEYAMHVGGRRGAGVESSIGVKQGCPLSPTLFGLLLDGLHAALLEGAPEAGPQLRGGQRVPDLGYADDFCLLATSAEGLQSLLDTAHGYLSSLGMEVSAEKSCVLVFGGGAAGARWSCGGAVLQQVEEYKYLGVHLSAAKGVEAAFGRLQQQTLVSWAVLRRQFSNLTCGMTLALQLHLFTQAVPQAASWGCEVWGLRHMVGQAREARQALAKKYLQYLRRLVQVRSSVAEAIVLRELGVRPLEELWWQRMVRWWNGLAEAPEGSLHRAVALSDLHDAIVRNIHNWSWSVYYALRDLGYDLQMSCLSMERIDEERVLAMVRHRSQECWLNLDICPRTCLSSGANLCKYARWFAWPEGVRRHALLSLPLGLSRMRTVVQFRMGCHRLPIVERQHAGVARAQRVCMRCRSGSLGDEKHMLFECAATQPVRDNYAHLFVGRVSMRDFFWQRDLRGVACCIAAALKMYMQPHD